MAWRQHRRRSGPGQAQPEVDVCVCMGKTAVDATDAVEYCDRYQYDIPIEGLYALRPFAWLDEGEAQRMQTAAGKAGVGRPPIRWAPRRPNHDSVLRALRGANHELDGTAFQCHVVIQP